MTFNAPAVKSCITMVALQWLKISEFLVGIKPMTSIEIQELLVSSITSLASSHRVSH